MDDAKQSLISGPMRMLDAHRSMAAFRCELAIDDASPSRRQCGLRQLVRVGRYGLLVMCGLCGEVADVSLPNGEEKRGGRCRRHALLASTAARWIAISCRMKCRREDATMPLLPHALSSVAKEKEGRRGIAGVEDCRRSPMAAA
nr:hypothetical protein Iba_chr09fCG11630 [Ipomoea batatas]